MLLPGYKNFFFSFIRKNIHDNNEVFKILLSSIKIYYIKCYLFFFRLIVNKVVLPHHRKFHTGFRCTYTHFISDVIHYTSIFHYILHQNTADITFLSEKIYIKPKMSNKNNKKICSFKMFHQANSSILLK